MKDKATIVFHSGDMDKLYSALIIANGALSMGMEASMYLTFWGLERLKKKGLYSGPLSKKNMFGLGKLMIIKRIRKNKVASLRRLLDDYKELGGKIIACEMTMDLMGVKRKDLREDVVDEYGAVGTYIKEARDSSITLFI